MQAWNLTKTFVKMFVLRAEPSGVPSSKALLLFMSVVLVMTKIAVYLWFMQIVNHLEDKQLIQLSYFGAGLVALTWVLVLFAFLRTALLYYKKGDRFVPGAISFVTMDCFLTALYLLWLAGLALADVPLQSSSIESIGIMLGFTLMMYWQFMVYIHLLVYLMDIPLLKAGVFALFYMLLQHNLSEVLLNIVIVVTPK